MENKVKLLIAVGASMTANCQPCLKTAVNEAQTAGLGDKEILEAVQIGRLVRKGAMGKMDLLASKLTGEDISGPEEKCPFGSTEENVKEWVSQNDECGCTE